MHPITNQYQKYQDGQIMTASGPELTLLLYEGAVKNLKKAKQALSNSDYEKANESLIKVQDIYYELMVTLDDSYEISHSLKQLYQFLIEKVLMINIRKNAKEIDEILPIAQEFVSTWKEAIKLAKQQG